MKDLPLRRGQLVTTFGPGSLVISPEGETAMVGALDKWYINDQGNRIDINQYELQEPRLKTLLKVQRLLAPPDYRAGYKMKNVSSAMKQENTDIFIPLLRFPQWHYCPNCRTMHKKGLSERTNRYYCRGCEKEVNMNQVPFVMVCSHGHISDFPWREWAHRDEHTKCEGMLRLISTPGATLDSLEVRCSCGKNRSLRGITTRKGVIWEGEEPVSELSKKMNQGGDEIYICPGFKPWFGSDQNVGGCTQSPVAVLKNSLNVYYPNTISAIYLPGKTKEAEEIIDFLTKKHVTATHLSGYSTPEDKLHYAMIGAPIHIKDIDRDMWELAIAYIENGPSIDSSRHEGQSDDANERLKQAEYDKLLKEMDSKHLKIRKEWNHADSQNHHRFSGKFNLINRVTKLKETIVLTGFNRLTTGTEAMTQENLLEGKKLLFNEPDAPQNDWLPAHEVYGEGIFFTLPLQKIKAWEKDPEVKRYFEKFKSRLRRQKSRIDPESLLPRKVLLHTLSHLVIDELALTCGYNASSIRERLYVSDEHVGVLIYTSSGDADGTFGGLVRMGREDHFFPIIEKAIEKASWCSSDPVCTEIGKGSGQGINQLNGAACHNCCYLPETSCELGNLLLDRLLLIDPKLGYFS
ncbi:DUF1998 domain-containing protein [Exiguobacterium sp. SH1S4]|nr:MULTISPECIES: DUF1998 domain-containing protein [unclassified Exiguobacterium]TCI42986.1 DUF1998 domain-containing protein [Exiguobacterium sp. SH5S32]TCI49740.1 DUF1998 domain-containing protein [Exiguobacterium sp. SH1S4]TCI67803.1 DUF1998 domain-containing protein [Exiguobacterium sp. SH1S1]